MSQCYDIDRNAVYEFCGCCGHYHPADWWGDCRDDSKRFTRDELEQAGVDDSKIVEEEP